VNIRWAGTAPANAAGPREPFRLRRLDLRAAGRDVGAHPELDALARRGAVPSQDIRERAAVILGEIERGGSAALAAASARHGGGPADGRLVIGREELADAALRLEPGVRDALDAAIVNVRRFATSQLPATTRTTIIPGVEIERRWVPVGRVGAYVPGGAAAYPSSLIMNVVPARVAGVDSIVVASPAGPDGIVSAVLLGAAGLLGVDSLIVAGGAQGIGALAFGLSDLGIAAADLVVGPGNAWVTAAKLELAGRVAIDLPAGPSEGMVVADPGSDPIRVAADLLTQAEHGTDSPALLVTTSAAFADDVEAAADSLLRIAPRRAILAQSLGAHGRVILVADLDAALAVVNAYAPEHLSVDVADPDAFVARVRNAGSVLVGPWAPESAGDYATGANHVLPTGGLARGCGALAVETFGKFIQVQRITRDGLAALRPTIRDLATAEGLPAHAQAVDVRFRVLGPLEGSGR